MEKKKLHIQSLSKGLVWYTYGSKSSSRAGGGVFGGITGLVISLSAFATLFQALMADIRESIARGYNGRTITIFTDSQDAFKALESVTVKSKLVLECLECLRELAHNSVELVWVSGHGDILGNVWADELTKKGADTPFTGPEPVLGLPYSVVKRAIGDCMERKHIEYWKSILLNIMFLHR